MITGLDKPYFDWLYGQAARERRAPNKTYLNLMRTLFCKEFVWFIPNDDNRSSDGKDLRLEFVREEDVDVFDPEWMDIGCSFLEMLIGLSRRFAFEIDGDPKDCFWEMINNLGLTGCDDRSPYSERKVEDIIDQVIFRTYDYNGAGGLFPLRYPDEDQREVELWYQLNAYLMENYF